MLKNRWISLSEKQDLLEQLTASIRLEKVLEFIEAAKLFGYFVPEQDENNLLTQSLILEAFRQRFRPKAVGPLSSKDTKVLSDLGQSYPSNVNS